MTTLATIQNGGGPSSPFAAGPVTVWVGDPIGGKR